MLILIVEDELDILENNRKALGDEGYTTLCAASLAEAREILSKHKPDGIILDIMLPDGNGLDYLKELRAKGNQTPIIMLTAWGKPSDISRGLDMGANDYVSKPFEYEVLMSRLKRMIRNVEQLPEKITKGALTLKIPSSEIVINDNALRLPQNEFSMLLMLVQNEGQIISEETLYAKIWGQSMIGDNRAVQNTISRLKKNLEGAGYSIVTVRGKGYVFRMEN